MLTLNAPDVPTGELLARHFRLAQVSIAVNGHPTLVEALEARLRLLRASAADTSDLVFEFCDASRAGRHLVEAPSGVRHVVQLPSQIEAWYSDPAERLHIRVGDTIRAVCAPKQGHLRASFLRLGPWELWALSHVVFTISLVEMLKQRGLYSVHAAGASLGNRGVVIAGQSGSGKSTLSLALTRAGFGFLGDDTLFLAPGPAGLRLLGFPDEMDVTDETIGLFPELAGLLAVPPRLPGAKRQVRGEDAYAAPVVAECRPAALLFPRVAHTERSRLRPMSQAEALLELAPNVLLTDARASQAHLDALAALARAGPCYRLDTGRDLDALPRRIQELLA
jgi:hypothetical protein